MSDTYVHGHHDSVLRSHCWLTAENSPGYLLPYLQSGMSLLDVGCGHGTITVDLASRIAPGTTVGVDREAVVIAEAVDMLNEHGARNVGFKPADLYSLDFEDRTFDVVHAHQVLQHLTDPVAALVEMRRVLHSDGSLRSATANTEGSSGPRPIHCSIAGWSCTTECALPTQLTRTLVDACSPGSEPPACRRSSRAAPRGPSRGQRTARGGVGCGPSESCGRRLPIRPSSMG